MSDKLSFALGNMAGAYEGAMEERAATIQAIDKMRSEGPRVTSDPTWIGWDNALTILLNRIEDGEHRK